MLYWRLVLISTPSEIVHNMWLVHDKCGMGVIVQSGATLSDLMDAVLAHKCEVKLSET